MPRKDPVFYAPAMLQYASSARTPSPPTPFAYIYKDNNSRVRAERTQNAHRAESPVVDRQGREARTRKACADAQ